MTPFGRKVRELRARAGVSQMEMARAIGVSPSYLSALERGRRGKPSWPTLQKIIGYFNIIWDEAEELVTLAGSSDPRIVIDTAGLPPEATELTNLLAGSISKLDAEDLAFLIAEIERRRRP